MTPKRSRPAKEVSGILTTCQNRPWKQVACCPLEKDTRTKKANSIWVFWVDLVFDPDSAGSIVGFPPWKGRAMYLLACEESVLAP